VTTNFYRLGSSAQPPTWRTRVSLLVWRLPRNLSGMGGPTSSYAAAGIALEFIGTHKHPHPATKCFRQGGNTIEVALQCYNRMYLAGLWAAKLTVVTPKLYFLFLFCDGGTQESGSVSLQRYRQFKVGICFRNRHVTILHKWCFAGIPKTSSSNRIVAHVFLFCVCVLTVLLFLKEQLTADTWQLLSRYWLDVFKCIYKSLWLDARYVKVTIFNIWKKPPYCLGTIEW
jgi:hypothetical protein